MNELLDKDNPILRQISKPITEAEFKSDWLKKLVQTMFAIMEEKEAVGIAAPQIGINKRVIVFGSSYTKKQIPESPIPDTILINPELKILSEEVQMSDEGCLNFPGIRNKIPRSVELEYTGFDLNGNMICKKAIGLEARILQHEVDHLNGILFIDYAQNKVSG